MNTRRLIIGASAAVFLFGCAHSKSRLKLGSTPEGEVVEAEGLAANNKSDLIATKKASLAEAQRNAVEKVVGVMISAKTLVEKAVAIENNILARTEGYVKKYDILEEGLQGELYRTKIRALVALKDLEADLKQLSLSSAPPLERPRIFVDLSEYVDNEKSEEKSAELGLSRSLTEQGFLLTSTNTAAACDFILTGKVTSLPFQTENLGGFVSYRARISLTAKRIGTSDVMATVQTEASGLGGTDQLAGLKALETVGTIAGNQLGQEISDKWKAGKNLLVMVEGVSSFSDVDRVKKHLESQPGVSDIALRLYEDNMAQFDLRLSSLLPAELAGHLEKSQSVPLKVLESSNQVLRLKLDEKK